MRHINLQIRRSSVSAGRLYLAAPDTSSQGRRHPLCDMLARRQRGYRASRTPIIGEYVAVSDGCSTLSASLQWQRRRRPAQHYTPIQLVGAWTVVECIQPGEILTLKLTQHLCDPRASAATAHYTRPYQICKALRFLCGIQQLVRHQNQSIWLLRAHSDCLAPLLL